MENPQKPESLPAGSLSDPSGSGSRMLIIGLCFGILALGGIAALVIYLTTPKPEKRVPRKMVPLVSVQDVHPQTETIHVQAMGSVIPARELQFKTRVAGEIVKVHPEFIAGGIVRAGETIAQIDDVDYKLIVAQRQSAVTDARFNLQLELGRQDVAQREWQLLNGDNPAPQGDSDLALRKPHLEKSRSDLEAAEAELEAARLQLARTRIEAPFNAIIRSTQVERGSQVAAQETLATLVGTDTYWVQVSVPVDRLQWIDIPDNHLQHGAQARITYHGGATRTGRVVKLLSDLESQGRMARLIVAVDDPLGLKDTGNPLPAMLIGEYVRVELIGQEVQGAYRIPRIALRDNSRVWVVGQDERLQVREVGIIWRDTQSVLVKEGLQPGDRLIVSDLATPVSGMALQVNGGLDLPIKPASAQEDGLPKG